jgi:hypothetical protein
MHVMNLSNFSGDPFASQPITIQFANRKNDPGIYINASVTTASQTFLKPNPLIRLIWKG